MSCTRKTNKEMDYHLQRHRESSYQTINGISMRSDGERVATTVRWSADSSAAIVSKR